MKHRNTLFLKVSLTLFLLMGVVGVVYLLIIGKMSDRYMEEVNQQLYGTIADSTVNTLPINNGEVDMEAIQDIMHSMMVINPSVEVYLLDPIGNIVTYVAPHKKVVREKVNLDPLLEFIEASKPKPYIKGDDPRDLERQKVFSASPIIQEGILQGYVYIILASEEQAAVTGLINGSYFLTLGTQYFFLAMLLALLVGVLVLWYLTRSLRDILKTFSRFQDGDLEARIPREADKDWYPLGATFNEMADTIVDNIEKIQSVEKLRKELIANVSHDLRTPLAIMQGYIETLLIKNETLTKEERLKYLQITTGGLQKITRLIDQLFEYTQLESLQIEPQKESFFLTELAHDVNQKYQVLAKKKGLKLSVEHPEALPMVYADIAMVERVLQNLIDNAIKFTPDGGHVRIELGEAKEGITVKVVDSGPGIPADKQSYIFERYHKLKASSHQPQEGTGLGLAIVKKILELHDTTINVQSQLNKGATFSFSLPKFDRNQGGNFAIG